MKKIWTWTRKWSFIIILPIMGLLYLEYTDNWQILLPIDEMRVDCEEADKKTGDIPNALQAGEAQVDISQAGEAQVDISQAGEAQPDVSQPDVSQPDTISPEAIVVEDDYFSDALFIGDSRTVGLYEYGGLEEIATFYASTGLTVYKMFDSPIVEVPGQKRKITVEEALQENQFAKIYLMIGINEMGTGTVESFAEKYREAVAHIQELQPDAIIYVQAIMKVTTERSEQGDYIYNEGIEARNAELAKLADNESIFYLDVNPVICDETGGMEPSYTFDGVHLKAQYTSIWKDFLKEHVAEQLVQEME